METHKFNALIVDDEALEREGLKRLIEAFSLPFYVHLASDGEVALAYLQTHPETDLLITDIQMSFRDGLSLIDMAHRLYPKLPVLIFSAYDKFDYAQRAISLNVSGYLLKPIEPALFLESMKKMLALCENNLAAGRETPATGKATSAASKTTTASQPDEHPTVALVRSIIEAEYNRDISLEYIAGRCSRSSTYLSSLFREQTGCSITGYIKDFRMKKAVELLKNTNMKVADIAATVGYVNPTYFNKVFHAEYHLSPGDYRKEAHRK